MTLRPISWRGSTLDVVVSNLKQEVVNAGTTVTQANVQPQRSGADASIPNLIRRSVRDDGPGGANSIPPPGVPSLASAVSSSPADPTNPKRGEITSTRWNSHYLIPSGSNFTAPDWVLVTRNGPISFSGWQSNLKDPTLTNGNYVIGRYAYAVYDEGGLLDMNLAGYPTWTANGGGGNPNPAPTPWMVNVGRKGIVTFADLTSLPAAATTFVTQTQINKIVGWRNYATTQQSGTSFTNPTFQTNALTKQDTYGSYLLDFGDPPFTDPSMYPFTSVATNVSNNLTDQALINRQELLRLSNVVDMNQNSLQYLGTFSRERNRPAPDWPGLNGKLSDRFDFTNLGMVQPNPPNTSNSRGKGATKSKGRGHIKGPAGDILKYFGLKWIPPDTNIADPRNLNYWGHWRYVGEQGPSDPSNPNALAHIPALRGGHLEFFRILDYAMTQANANNDDPASPAAVLAVGASLIDQYDDPADDIDTTAPAARQTHTTIIEYSGGYVLGWENGDTNDPHASNKLNMPTPTTAVVINHAFSNVGEFGYGLKPTSGFQPLDFTTEASTDRPVLDFFTFNPVSGSYPRAGVVNLNTKNWPVLAAILKNALKTDAAASSNPPSPVISQAEATTAAQAIVTETSARPVLNRGDVARLVRVAGNAIGATQEQKEAVARALVEMGQARTWNLLIDVIAQTGRYAPNAQSLTDFIPEGEKRYWLHIAIGRDLNAGSVDVLGQQLEEVTE